MLIQRQDGVEIKIFDLRLEDLPVVREICDEAGLAVIAR